MLDTVLRNVRRSMLRHDEARWTDGALLERFITQQDEAAFEGLVRRHGPMVLGVCRRVLRNDADAEDAFQATFLVLVRRAGAVRPRGMVGNWLYGVAQNTARKAKAMNTRRWARERQAGSEKWQDSGIRGQESGETDWQEQQALLDQELQALPDKYRAPIVLCDLEGKSIREAARHLDCPSGTIGTRLARGRVMLARRLTRRGLPLSGGMIATVLSQQAASASVPLPLLTSTVKAASLFAAGQAARGVVGAKAAALTEGALKTMLLTKLKVATAALVGIALAVACASGTVSPGPSAFAQTEGKKDGAPRKTEPPKEAKAKSAKEKIQGTWELIDEEVNGGMSATFDKTNPPVWVITADKIEIKKGKKTLKATYRVDPSKSPMELDITRSDKAGKDETTEDIYQFDKDGNLIICGGRYMLERPKDFKVKRGSGYFVRTFKRLPAVNDEQGPKTEPGKPAKENAPERDDGQLGRPQLGPPQLSRPPKKDIPPWEKEFRKIYSLADGEVLKRISPFPECRVEYIRNSPRLQPGTDAVPIHMALRVHQKETKGELHLWGFGGGDATIFSVMWQIGIPMGEVEADKKLLDTPIGGDFVFRQDAPVEKLVPALERILRDECKLSVKLTFKEVEREAVVARGVLKVVPLEGQKKNHVEVFGNSIGKGEAWGSRKDLHGFLIDLGGFLGRRIVNEARSGTDEIITYGLSVRQVPQHQRPGPLDPNFNPADVFDPAIEAEDRNPKLVLANVSKQTGLTFTSERRNIRVLFVEKAER